MKKLEDYIKHGPHCLAGKYSTMGRCSCGAQAALEELAALRKAAQQCVQADDVVRCPICKETSPNHDVSKHEF